MLTRPAANSSTPDGDAGPPSQPATAAKITVHTSMPERVMARPDSRTSQAAIWSRRTNDREFSKRIAVAMADGPRREIGEKPVVAPRSPAHHGKRMSYLVATVTFFAACSMIDATACGCETYTA